MYESEIITMTIAPELFSELDAKAEAMSSDFETTVVALIRIGLEEQNRREQEIEDLREQARRCDDPRLKQEIGDKLGRLIFGQ